MKTTKEKMEPQTTRPGTVRPEALAKQHVRLTRSQQASSHVEGRPMQSPPALARCLCLLVLCCFSAPLAHSSPRPPWPPWPEQTLQRWQFDEPYVFGADDAEAAVLIDDSVWQESWSGYALNRRGRVVAPVSVPMVTPTHWNLAPEYGAVRIWFKPGWTTGTGPGDYARLLELTSGEKKNSILWWSLYVSPDGGTIYLSGEVLDGAVDYLKADIQWQADEWHLLTVSYTPDGTYLHLDNALVAIGAGLPGVPVMITDDTRLTIGSDAWGKGVAQGQFEELATFERPYSDAWTESDLYFYYRGVSQQAAKGPVTEAEEAAMLAQVAELQAARELGLLDEGGGQYMMESMEGLYLLTPEIIGTNVNLTIMGGQTNESYNIEFTTDLLAVPWVTAWIGTQGQTNFTLVVTTPNGFYRAQVGDDWDGDGVPNWEDADPSNPSIGILALTIDSPANGTTVY